jgi:hypothetical protein
VQVLALLVFLAAGVVVCGLASRAVVLRYGLPWRQALEYFGIVPYRDGRFD